MNWKEAPRRLFFIPITSAMTPRHKTSLAPVAMLLGAVALFACWLVPGHYFPWVSFQNEVVAALAGTLFGVAAVAMREGGSPRWPRASTFFALLALIPLLQYGLGQISFRSDAALSFLYLASLALAVSAGATLSRASRRRFLDHVFGALLAAGIASVGLALAQWLNLGLTDLVEWLPPGYRAIGNIAHPNHLAGLLALACLGGLWFYETRRINGPALCAVVLWLAFGMALTRTRMVWAAALVFALWWIWVCKKSAPRLKPGPVLLWLLAFFGVVAAIGPLSEAVMTYAPESVGERLQSGGGRLRIWAAMADGLMQSPWVGYGWSQASIAGLAGSLHHFTGESMLRNAHSLPLDLLIWNGIPLGLLVMGLAGLWWWQAVKQTVCVERAVVLAAVGLISLYSMIEFPLESFHFLVPFGLLVGALEGWSDAREPARAPRVALAFAVVCVAALAARVAIEYLDVENASRNGRMRAAGLAASAVLPSTILLDEPVEYIRFWFTQARAGMPETDLRWMRKITARNPSPPSLLRYATATGLNGQPEMAAKTLIQLCNMHRAKRCDEGRKSWGHLQQNFPCLSTIPFPATPTPP